MATTETVITANMDKGDFDKLIQEIADETGKTNEEVSRSVGDADGVVRITRDTDGNIADVQYGEAGGRRRKSRLNKKTRRTKGRRRHSVRRKLRKLTSRRR